MYIPLQVSLHGIAPSDALIRAIRDKALKLEHLYDRITGCRVALARDARQPRQGKQFSVHVRVKVPGGAIEATREHDANLYIALREAFDAARREIEDYAREECAAAKRQCDISTGTVIASSMLRVAPPSTSSRRRECP